MEKAIGEEIIGSFLHFACVLMLCIFIEATLQAMDRFDSVDERIACLSCFDLFVNDLRRNLEQIVSGNQVDVAGGDSMPLLEDMHQDPPPQNSNILVTKEVLENSQAPMQPQRETQELRPPCDEESLELDDILIASPHLVSETPVGTPELVAEHKASKTREEGVQAAFNQKEQNCCHDGIKSERNLYVERGFGIREESLKTLSSLPAAQPTRTRLQMRQNIENWDRRKTRSTTRSITSAGSNFAGDLKSVENTVLRVSTSVHNNLKVSPHLVSETPVGTPEFVAEHKASGNREKGVQTAINQNVQNCCRDGIISERNSDVERGFGIREKSLNTLSSLPAAHSPRTRLQKLQNPENWDRRKTRSTTRSITSAGSNFAGDLKSVENAVLRESTSVHNNLKENAKPKRAQLKNNSNAIQKRLLTGESVKSSTAEEPTAHFLQSATSVQDEDENLLSGSQLSLPFSDEHDADSCPQLLFGFPFASTESDSDSDWDADLELDRPEQDVTVSKLSLVRKSTDPDGYPVRNFSVHQDTEGKLSANDFITGILLSVANPTAALLDVMFEFRVDTKESSVPGAGRGAFLTFLRARRVNKEMMIAPPFTDATPATVRGKTISVRIVGKCLESHEEDLNHASALSKGPNLCFEIDSPYGPLGPRGKYQTC